MIRVPDFERVANVSRAVEIFLADVCCTLVDVNNGAFESEKARDNLQIRQILLDARSELIRIDLAPAVRASLVSQIGQKLKSF